MTQTTDHNDAQAASADLQAAFTDDTMQVVSFKVGDEIYVIPLANIIESLRPTTKDVRSLPGGGDVLLIRGE